MLANNFNALRKWSAYSETIYNAGKHHMYQNFYLNEIKTAQVIIKLKAKKRK